MKFLLASTVTLSLTDSSSSSSSSSSFGCRDKVVSCDNRVQVNITSAVDGMLYDSPHAVYSAFVAASIDCLECVSNENVEALTFYNYGCNYQKCKNCGEYDETWQTCRTCCGECRCMGCDSNYGLQGDRKCDADWGWNYQSWRSSCCSSRRLGDESFESSENLDVTFSLDVCMDDVSPLEGSSSHYVDFHALFDDFQVELAKCYDNKDVFINSWSSYCSDAGIDLSLMARTQGDVNSIMFGLAGLDTEDAVITTTTSSESHRSTSNIMFYSALGFVFLSAFAVGGTAMVVKVLKIRDDARQAQQAAWVSDISNVDIFVNDASPF